MLGFETIGSATLIFYDGEPILTTDAWINEDAYFGSWCHDYEIPSAQLDAIKRAKYHWFSHGHPDHLNSDALPQLTQGQFLLSNHHGSRIERDLIAAGHRVQILPDRDWISLSPHIKVCSFTNQNQDSVLLIEINGRLVIDANDSPDYGAGWHIKRIAKHFREVYLCQLHGWGGADMVNVYDPAGRPLTDIAAKRRPIAPRAQRAAIQFGANKVIPFSSFHRFQRQDSVWANALVPELEDYQAAANPTGPQMLPAFVSVNCENDSVALIAPARVPQKIRDPGEFGDNWSDPLEQEDIPALEKYFRTRQHLAQHFGFIEIKTGGRSHRIELNRERRDIGITFECPRTSLMTCVNYEIFDDLLLGNYMKTTLHGVESLYPNFSPYVAKYADNGGAKSGTELAAYFRHYRARDPVGFLMSRFTTASEQMFRNFVTEDSAAFKVVKRAYYLFGQRR